VSFRDYLDQIRRDVARSLTQEETSALADLLRPAPAEEPDAGLKRRPLVERWTVATLLHALERAQGGGDPERGQRVFTTALCYRCHRFQGQGGMVGPDLTGATRRFNTADLLEAIVEPSRVISDQYRGSQLALRDGRVLAGKPRDISGNTLLLMRDPLNPADLVMVPRDQIEEISWSGVSLMPDRLLDTFTGAEVKDLIAFLRTAEAEDRAAREAQR
jgi:putative heme-binding domain-containing protein